MNLFEKVKLPVKAAKKANGGKMKFSILATGNFEQIFRQKTGLLLEMPSVHEHINEEVDYSRPRVM